jgi:HSP20 family protein
VKGDISKQLLKTIRNRSAHALGDEFWNDISELIPKQGPRIDAFRIKEKIIVFVELPGFIPKDHIQITLLRHALRVKGSIPAPYETDEKQVIFSERFFGPFDRKIPIPSDVIAEEVKAYYEAGVLVVEVSITEDTNHQQIDIDFGEGGNA